jgi:hypothetical protein
MISPQLVRPDRRVATRPVSRPSRMTTRRRLTLAVAALAVILGLIWAVGHFGRDTRMADINELREKLLDPSLAAEDRQTIQDEVHRRMQALLPELQKQTADGGTAFLQFWIAHMKDVIDLPDDKRMAAIDQDIDNMKSMSKWFRGGGPPGGKGSQSDRPASSQGSGGRGSGWPGAQSTEAQRNAFHNRLLSSIPADSRARLQIYMQLMQVRIIQRGIN